ERRRFGHDHGGEAGDGRCAHVTRILYEQPLSDGVPTFFPRIRTLWLLPSPPGISSVLRAAFCFKSARAVLCCIAAGIPFSTLLLGAFAPRNGSTLPPADALPPASLAHSRSLEPRALLSRVCRKVRRRRSSGCRRPSKTSV